MVDLFNRNDNEPESTEYITKLLRGNTKVVTKEFLKSINVPDIVSITISSKVYINKSHNIIQEHI